MMSKLVKVALIGGLSIIGSVQLAGAAPIINGAAGLASPTESLTFSEIGLANGTSLTNEYGGFGVTFSGVWYNSQTVGPNINSPNLTNYQAPDGPTVFQNPFSILFTSVVSAAQVNFVSQPGTSMFEALLNNVIVESFNAATDLTTTNNFFGFTGIAFDELRITAPLTTNQAALFDNLQFVEVPEPATLVLFGLGLAGLGFARRRKSA